MAGPGSIPWEIGNSCSAMFKRNSLSLEEAKRGLEIFKRIPLRYIEPDFANAHYNLALAYFSLEKYKFAVITFEHDNYADQKNEVKTKAQKYLESLGYELVVNNIAPDNFNGYEDWYVHPSLVKREIIDKMKDTSDKPKRCDKYMLGRC